MLGKRYEYDGKPIIKLNPLQETVKDQIKEKIEQGRYRTEKVPCIVCGSEDFEQLSEKDRFGLRMSVVICNNCGLIQTNPRLTKESFNEFYRTEHTKLIFGEERTTQALFLDQYFHAQTIYKYLGNILPKHSKDTFVLEAGCGAGGILAYFRDKGFEVAGSDLDEDCVMFGRENYNLDLRVGNLKECGFGRKPDVVIMSHILEHLLNPDEELSLIRSLMDARGMLYVEVPGARNLSYIYTDMDFLHYLQIPHVYHFSLTTLGNLLNKNGFTLIRGDEKVKSIFAPGEKRESYKNDYRPALSYLRRLEMLRKHLPVTPFKVRYFIESAYCWLLRKTGLYNFFRVIYRRMIQRTNPKGSF